MAKKLSKKHGRAAMDQFLIWKEEGVPNLIEPWEAFRLTKGKVGKSFDECMAKRPGPMLRLIDVAVKFTK